MQQNPSSGWLLKRELEREPSNVLIPHIKAQILACWKFQIFGILKKRSKASDRAGKEMGLVNGHKFLRLSGMLVRGAYGRNVGLVVDMLSTCSPFPHTLSLSLFACRCITTPPNPILARQGREKMDRTPVRFLFSYGQWKDKVLCPVYVSLPFRHPSHGPCSYIYHRRCRCAIQEDARIPSTLRGSM